MSTGTLDRLKVIEACNRELDEIELVRDDYRKRVIDKFRTVTEPGKYWWSKPKGIENADREAHLYGLHTWDGERSISYRKDDHFRLRQLLSLALASTSETMEVSASDFFCIREAYNNLVKEEFEREIENASSL